MRRRELILMLGGAVAAWPLAGRAQQKAMPVIGYLSSYSSLNPFVAAFRQGLTEVGYVEGQNLTIEYRWAENRYERLPALAADLVGRKVDLIGASGGDLSSRAAQSATSTIPIVSIIGDPVAAGLVASLARPGGNLTGVSFLDVELTPKRLELLSELVPQASEIALLVNQAIRMPSASCKTRRRRRTPRAYSSPFSRPAPKARSTPPSPRSSNCALAGSSSVPIRSSPAGASRS
jgi:putative ABC transport system substrate-binding protein